MKNISGVKGDWYNVKFDICGEKQYCRKNFDLTTEFVCVIRNNDGFCFEVILNKYGNHNCFLIEVKWIRIVKMKRTVWDGIFMYGLCEKFWIGVNIATWLRAFKSNCFILLNCAWQWILFCLIEGLFTNLVRVFHSISVQQLNVNWIFEKWWWNNVIYIDL